MYYIKKFLIHIHELFLISITLVGIGITFFVSNQNWLLPKIAIQLTHYSIPFNIFVPSANKKVLSVHGTNFDDKLFTLSEKKKLNDLVARFNDLARKNSANIIGSDGSDQVFSDQFANGAKFSDRLNQLYRPEHQNLNSVILTAIGADKYGRFVVLDYIMQNDSPNLLNYCYKFYLDKDFKLSKFSKSYPVIKNTGGLAKIYPNYNNLSAFNKGQVTINQLFNQMKTLNLYGDKNNLAKNENFQNLTNGFSKKSKNYLAELISVSNGNFNNYAFTQYVLTDSPNAVKITTVVGGVNKRYKFNIVYNATENKITEIN